MIKTIWVAGATGYTGSEVVRQAASQGFRTIAHIRPDSASLPSWAERWKNEGALLDSTAWEEEALAAALRTHEVDLVFCLIGTTKARSKGKKDAEKAAVSYEAIDYGYTALLVRAALASGRPLRFVYLSSMGVRPASSLPYIHARWKAEEVVRASGLPSLIARPGFISGPDRKESRPLEQISARFSDHLLAFVALFVGKKRKFFLKFRSFSAAELASCLLKHALSPNFQTATLEADALRTPQDSFFASSSPSASV